MEYTELDKELQVLKEENLELRLTAIRKDVSNLKIDLHRHLDRILEQTSKTNGSVARALERIYTLERQDNKIRIEEVAAKFEQYKKDTAFWHLISKNKWVASLIIFALYAFSIPELRVLLLSIFRF